ncbi:MAG: hypothetical protein QG604_589 [Candidatus Dependentiae bacterium]|nr:hypothetical protein [Candidatus Dependentiae bacterium]
MMSFQRRCLVLLFVSSSFLCLARSEQPRTIFIPRSMSSSALYTDGFSLLATHDREHKRVMLFGHSLLYQESFNHTKSAPFFLGNDRTKVIIDEGEEGDINPDWFHIQSATDTLYKSTLSVAPKRLAIGVCLRAQYILDDILDGLWAAVVLPIVNVTHTLNVAEFKNSATQVSPTSAFGSVERALDWDNWRAGKWSGEPQSITGLDDMVCQLGLDIDGPLNSMQQIALEIVVPVGGRPTGQYLFEPLIGSQGSVGIGGSIKTVAPVYQLNKNCLFSYIGHLGYRYHLPCHQPRLFDLKGQPFSRYLVYMDTALRPDIANVVMKAANGGNFFLRESLVTPGATGQSINALEMSISRHRINVGYMYWWRVAEQVTFAEPLTRTFAVPSPQGLDSGDLPLWLSGPKISDSFSALDVAISTSPAIVQDIEFDVDSGAMPQVASHTLFVDYNSSFIHDIATCTVRLGFAYEFAHTPTVLDSLHLWCGIGITL